MEYISNFFYGLIERWNNWIAYLEYESDRKEKALITLEGNEKIPKVLPHLVFKSYQESNFPYNLNGAKIKETGNSEVDLWIKDFALLNIDIYEMIKKEHTLPDATFLKKRYLLIQKQVHPDRSKGTPTGSTQLSTEVNVAKETLDRLYEDPIQQITLFQTVFSVIQKEPTPIVATTNHPHQSTAPYIILYLVGAGIGTILVLRWSKEKKKGT